MCVYISCQCQHVPRTHTHARNGTHRGCVAEAVFSNLYSPRQHALAHTCTVCPPNAHCAPVTPSPRHCHHARCVGLASRVSAHMSAGMYARPPRSRARVRVCVCACASKSTKSARVYCICGRTSGSDLAPGTRTRTPNCTHGQSSTAGPPNARRTPARTVNVGWTFPPGVVRQDFASFVCIFVKYVAKCNAEI